MLGSHKYTWFYSLLKEKLRNISEIYNARKPQNARKPSKKKTAKINNDAASSSKYANNKAKN
jgi:hypothetical protein